MEKGDRIECIFMLGDPKPISSGTQGTITCVDDLGTIHVKWDNGRTLGLIKGIDKFKLIEKNKMSSLKGNA